MLIRMALCTAGFVMQTIWACAYSLRFRQTHPAYQNPGRSGRKCLFSLGMGTEKE